MAWIEFHQSLVTHHKLSTLAGELGVRRPQAAGHLAFMWCWALDNARDGNLTHVSYRAIADAAGWTKKPELFVAALRKSGFTCSARCIHDVSDDQVILHDWQDYAGRLIEKRVSDAERKRRARMSGGHPADGAGTQPTQPTIPNQPAPDQRAREAATGAAYKAVQDLLGLLNPTVADAVGAELDEGISPEWIVAACEEAAKNNARRWNYVEAILRRWQRDGFRVDRRPKAIADERLAAHDAELAAVRKKAGV